jgi:uncharacterized membrane protein
MELKFNCDIEVDSPVERVAELWADPENLQYWQEGFLSIEHLSGEKGQAGAKSKMRYLMRNKEMDLFETILNNGLPREFKGQYDHEMMSNTMLTRFTETESGGTLYWSEFHYTEMKGFTMKLMARLFPSMFKKQVMKWMVNFKNHVESLN